MIETIGNTLVVCLKGVVPLNVAEVWLKIGLLRLGRSLRWSGVLLIAGGVSFIIAQALLIGLQLFYPLAMVFLLAGSRSIGWRLLNGEQEELGSLDYGVR